MCLRSSRSIITPLKGSTAIAGSVVSTRSSPSESSEWVFCSTYQVTPAEFIPLPNMEIRLARNTNRSGLCCRIFRMRDWIQSTRFSPQNDGAGTDSDCDIIRLGMVYRQRRAYWISAALIFATVLAFAADRRPSRSGRPIRNAFYANQEIQVQPVLEPSARNFNYGPWTFGSLVADDKASDRRFN